MPGNICKFLVLSAIILCASAARADAEQSFRRGIALYESESFEAAIPEFERAVELSPKDSHYHHWLGKAYGRSAERATWFRAVRLARKTLHEFVTAVQLDGSNTDALRDLLQYYRRAPVFLGGGDRKAEEIEQRLSAAFAAQSTAGVDGEVPPR